LDTIGGAYDVLPGPLVGWGKYDLSPIPPRRLRYNNMLEVNHHQRPVKYTSKVNPYKALNFKGNNYMVAQNKTERFFSFDEMFKAANPFSLHVEPIDANLHVNFFR